jgi:hypothetical protein
MVPSPSGLAMSDRDTITTCQSPRHRACLPFWAAFSFARSSSISASRHAALACNGSAARAGVRLQLGDALQLPHQLHTLLAQLKAVPIIVRHVQPGFAELMARLQYLASIMIASLITSRPRPLRYGKPCWASPRAGTQHSGVVIRNDKVTNDITKTRKLPTAAAWGSQGCRESSSPYTTMTAPTP